MTKHQKLGKKNYSNMTKVSYVCPVFNKIKYLEDVLSSIENQIGDFDKEYIFINDGSTDGSLDFLKTRTSKWKNKFILNQNNQGPAVATQVGISIANGDYIKLVGGDDVMSPFCSEILLETIVKTNAVAAFSSYKLLKNFNDIYHEKNTVDKIKTIREPLFETVKSCFSGTTPNLYCNTAIKKSDGCNVKIFIEDFSLVLELSKLGSFSFIENTTSYGPIDDESRIMVGKKTQLTHDYNAALYYFLKKNINIDKKISKVACLKSLGRAEKWYRREMGKTKLNKMNLHKIFLFLGRKDYLNLIKESCMFFYTHSDRDSIRYRIK